MKISYLRLMKRLIFVFLLLFSCFSCTKKYKIKNYLEGTWKVEKFSYLSHSGFESYPKFTGETNITRTGENTFTMHVKINLPEDDLTYISDLVELTFSNKYKNLTIEVDDDKEYGNVHLITKDELSIEYSKDGMVFKIVGGK